MKNGKVWKEQGLGSSKEVEVKKEDVKRSGHLAQETAKVRKKEERRSLRITRKSPRFI